MDQSTESTTDKDDSLSLPSSVTVLDAPLNGKVYVIGTAHFSVKSQEEVIEAKFLLFNLSEDRISKFFDVQYS